MTEEQKNTTVLTDPGSSTKEQPKISKLSNIVLIGLPGAGKSAIGWTLAKMIGYGYIDFDSWLEDREGKKISDLLEKSGEEYLKKSEQNILSILAAAKNHVIVVKSRTLMGTDNLERLQKMGTVVWLDTGLKEIVHRFRAKKSPDEKNRMLSAIGLNQKEGEETKLILSQLEQFRNKGKDLFSKADIVFEDECPDPETSARQLERSLTARGIIDTTNGKRRLFHRWKKKQ